jgi:hypothetical protein
MKNAFVLTERGMRERERESERIDLTIIFFIPRSYLHRQTICQIQAKVKTTRKALQIAKLFHKRKIYL